MEYVNSGRRLLWILAVSGIGLWGELANACSCAAYPDDVEQAVSLAYAQADVVFLGDVTSSTRKWMRSPQARETSFHVLKSWKGLAEDNTTALVRSNIGEIACGYKFDRNGQYLVFAYWDAKGQILVTTFCDLTRMAAEAGEHIDVLEKIAAQTSGGATERPKSESGSNPADP